VIPPLHRKQFITQQPKVSCCFDMSYIKLLKVIYPYHGKGSIANQGSKT